MSDVNPKTTVSMSWTSVTALLDMPSVLLANTRYGDKDLKLAKFCINTKGNHSFLRTTGQSYVGNSVLPLRLVRSLKLMSVFSCWVFVIAFPIVGSNCFQAVGKPFQGVAKVRFRSAISKDYYSILGVPESASQAEIKARYRNLAKVWYTAPCY